MPELPEVETTRRGIAPHIEGKRVLRVLVRQPSLRWPVSDDLAQCVTGQRVEVVERRAKYLLVVTPAGRVMIHLGMSGSLRILKQVTPPEKHDHIDFEFEDGTILRFRDPRRFGSVFWLPVGSDHTLLGSLGPEPLSGDFTGDYLFRRSRGRKLAVKLMIMDAKVVVGVGNIYANEALFMAGIRPGLAAGRISRARYSTLAIAIKQVLAEAIDAGGTTLRDFVREDGQTGYFQQALRVYGRGDLPCTGCKVSLKEIRQGGRTTVYCPVCQQ